MGELGPTRVDPPKIARQIALLSERLSMVPDDGSLIMRSPATQRSLALSEWLEETRQAFLELSVQVGQALDLDLQ